MAQESINHKLPLPSRAHAGLFAEEANLRDNAVRGSERLRRAIQRMMDKRPKPPVVRLLPPPPPPIVCDPNAPVAERLAAIAAQSAGVTVSEFYGPSRKAEVVRPRQAVMLVLREVRGWSYPRIAEALCRDDHTTVMHGCKRADALRAASPNYARLCAKLAEAAA